MMDTPEKSQIGTPVSKFEESPFSNFINSLSPIKPSKTIHISQTISSLSFTSPPSVFTSPHVNLQKESRFVKRYQLAELAKQDFISDKENKNVTMEGIDIPANCSENLRDVGAGEESSTRDGFTEAPQEIPDLLIDLPRELKYDCGSPSCETAPVSGCEMKSEPDTFGCVSISEDEPCTRESFGTQRNLLDGENSTEGAGCDWDNMIPDTAADLLVFSSPGDSDIFKGLCEGSVDAELNLLNSLLSQHSEDGCDHQQQLYLSEHGCISSDVLFQSEDHIGVPEQGDKRKHIDQGQDNTGSCPFNETFNGGEDNESLENEPNMHRGIRRRCLVFEIPGARKNVNGSLMSSSSHSFQGEATILSTSKPINRRPLVGESSKCILPAIGLHLNAIAVASKDCRPSENLSSEMQPVPLAKSCDPLPSLTTGPDTMDLTAPDSLEKDGGNFEMEVQIGEEASQGSENAVNEDLSQNSPKKKRRRTETTGEDGACKRCNCKKSKCLKLYCECFAAGVYCVEPCSCQDCFNKPIHEDTVLATRKQIESRNPLAFAPKVIRNTDSVTDLGQDDSNRTPASARHKRGCNCKKSSCLKKYCECYQGGVGCSISCRCEGCKNAFGRKDGSTSIGREIITEEDMQIEENSIVDKSSNDDEEMNPMTVLPKTPLRVFRSGVQIPTSSKGGKPPRMLGVSSSSALMHPCDGPGRSTYLRTQPKVDQKNIPSSIGTSGDEMPLLLQSHTSSPNGGIKTLSPNSKRISPPHHHQDTSSQTPGLRSSRKLILQSIPSFPALTPRRG